MKKRFLLIATSVLCAVFSFGQTGDIIMKRGGKFESDGQTLKPREVLKIMESNPEAHAEFKKAKSNYDVSMAFGYVGGFLVGWPLGTALGGGDPQWGMAAAGAGLILISLPINSAFKKRARSALELYNGKPQASRKFKPTFHATFFGTGAKLSMKL